jgi:hypothetical protein
VFGYIYFELNVIALALHSQQHLLMSHELQHVSHQSHPHIQLTSSGLDMAKIAEYIDSAGVVLAVPSSCTEKGEAVVKQANTILTMPKIHTMVSSKTDALLCLVTYIFN